MAPARFHHSLWYNALCGPVHALFRTSLPLTLYHTNDVECGVVDPKTVDERSDIICAVGGIVTVIVRSVITTAGPDCISADLSTIKRCHELE